MKVYLVPHRRRWLLTHWFDVLIVAIPFLRPLRIVRSLRVLRALRAARVLSLGASAAVDARTVLGRNGLHYALLVGGLLFVSSAAAVTLFERDAGGGITNFGQSLWWAAATITTVGYGDVVPVTPEGRGVGVFLMFIGVTLFSFLTANLLIAARRCEFTVPSDLERGATRHAWQTADGRAECR